MALDIKIGSIILEFIENEKKPSDIGYVLKQENEHISFIWINIHRIVKNKYHIEDIEYFIGDKTWKIINPK